MIAPDTRVVTHISDQELERRWGLVRREMLARKIDVLVMQNTNDWLGGYVKWFTDLPANNGYPRTVLFYARDPMTGIEMGPLEARRNLDGRDPLHRGVGELLHTPSFPSIDYTHRYDAELALGALRRRGLMTIGWVGQGAIPHALVQCLEQGLGNARFIDATGLVDAIKAIKSAEEVALIQQC